MASLSISSNGPAVRQLQEALKREGFYRGTVDGKFGNGTAEAVRQFQEERGLDADGKAGRQTFSALGLTWQDGFQSQGQSGTGSQGTQGTSSSGGVGNPTGMEYRARATGYYPDSSTMEGGFKDRLGKPLYTLQAYLAGNAPYVSVAMDSDAFRYGTKLRIPELERKYGRVIDFRVVDTGGAFEGKGTSRIDICTRNQSASVDPAVNRTLTLVRVG